MNPVGEVWGLMWLISDFHVVFEIELRYVIGLVS